MSQKPPTPPNPPDPPILPPNANGDDVLKGVVRWVQQSPFRRPVDIAPEVQGWDARVQEYAYEFRRNRITNYKHVHHFVLPIIAAIQEIIEKSDWNEVNGPNDLNDQDRQQLEFRAETICGWGGNPKGGGYGDTWRVVKSAHLGGRFNYAPMNSGWSKVASFATRPNAINAQTIWDSRVSTSVVWRIDQILHHNRLNQHPMDDCHLGVVPTRGRAGTRPRNMNFPWPNAYGLWPYHLGGSQVVRRMVQILNEPGNRYPRMPQPDGILAEWDVFGVGLVLFMDGY